MSVLVEILVESLLDSNRLTSSNRQEKLLHQHNLNKLQKIGPEYPQVSRCSHIKIRLATRGGASNPCCK